MLARHSVAKSVVARFDKFFSKRLGDEQGFTLTAAAGRPLTAAFEARREPNAPWFLLDAGTLPGAALVYEELPCRGDSLRSWCSGRAPCGFFLLGAKAIDGGGKGTRIRGHSRRRARAVEVRFWICVPLCCVLPLLLLLGPNHDAYRSGDDENFLILACSRPYMVLCVLSAPPRMGQALPSLLRRLSRRIIPLSAGRSCVVPIAAITGAAMLGLRRPTITSSPSDQLLISAPSPGYVSPVEGASASCWARYSWMRLTICAHARFYPRRSWAPACWLGRLLSIIIGFAAQRTIANLFAGFQLALTQPIRLDDAVIVENEWGRIEEITLTYVVVCIWDMRRLIVPLSYFIEKPFQNWTRTRAEILGTVYLCGLYDPGPAVREELNASRPVELGRSSLQLTGDQRHGANRRTARAGERTRRLQGLGFTLRDP